jgi:hypothetical protein
MIPTDAAQRFAQLERRVPLDEYNFTHFRTKHLVRDGKRTATDRGFRPGEPAPDFELPQVGGGALRLSAFRGRPVLLHFGSFS